MGGEMVIYAYLCSVVATFIGRGYLRGTVCMAALFCVILLSGCNREVFVERFMPDIPEEIVLDAGNPEYTVSFLSDNWDIQSFYSSSFSRVECRVTDLEGNPVSWAFGLLPGLGIVDAEVDGLCRCRLARRDGNSLEIRADNAAAEEVVMTLVVGNDYDSRSLSLRIVPSSGHVVDIYAESGGRGPMGTGR